MLNYVNNKKKNGNNNKICINVLNYGTVCCSIVQKTLFYFTYNALKAGFK